MAQNLSGDENLSEPASDDEFPAWYQEENQSLQARVVVKFIMPDGSQSWVAAEFEGDNLLFIDVIGVEIELWCFSDDELQYLRSDMGVPIERKTFFEFKSVDDLIDGHSDEKK